MALTRITKGVIKPNENYDTHNINSTGIITAVGGNFSGNVSVGGVLTYEDVTSIDSVGIITAQKDIHVGAGVSVVGVVTATTFVGALTGTASGNTTIIGAGNNKIVTSYQNNELVAENGLTWTGSVFETSGGAETWTMRAKSGGPSSKIGFQNQYLTNGFTIGCGAANQSFVVYTGGNNERVRIDSTGITTFSQNLFASKDLDVDGHTNLDNVSIAGVTTFTGDAHFKGGAEAIKVFGDSDIRFAYGTWTGNTSTPKIQAHNNYLYIAGGASGIIFRENATNRWQIDGNGNLEPSTDSTYDIGESNLRVRNGYFDTLYGDGSNLTNVISGVDVKFEGASVGTGVTMLNFVGFNTVTPPVSGLSTITSGQNLTIGVRSGSAVEASLTGTSFNVIARSGGNISINI